MVDQVETDKEREQLGVKSNDIMQKNRYSLNAMEQKIVIYLISKIKPEDKEFAWYDFEIREFCKVCRIDYNNGKNYKDVKEAIENLQKKQFSVENENGIKMLCAWISKAKQQKGNGTIRIRLDEDLREYLLAVSKNFTQCQLCSILLMKSQYSPRIYELLKLYTWMGVCSFDIDKLKRQLVCENYERFPDFKRNVLDIAVREINEFTDIEVSWEPVKIGKRIAQIKFIVKPQEGREKAFAGGDLSELEKLQEKIEMFEEELRRMKEELKKMKNNIEKLP